MISYADALNLIDANVEPLGATPLSLDQIGNAANADPVTSKLDVPAFANAAMDGFALRAADTSDATAEAPLHLPVTGIVAAGDAPADAPPRGAAIEIMTGAPLPRDCDSVIPIERVETETDAANGIVAIGIREPLETGRNVRSAGEDFRAGQIVLEGGQPAEPHDVMALAATGNDRIVARTMPRIAIITTGSELADAGAPADPGMIRDANGPYLQAFIESIGATQTTRINVADRSEDLEAALESASHDADVILTTGGVSAGRYDLIPDAIERLGGRIVFHKVAIRPGKPLLFARLPNKTLLFGLPGNPIAAAVGLRFFVVRSLRRLQGLPPENFHAAVSDERIRKRSSLCFFGKASARADADGRLRVTLLPGQESFKIKPLTKANCWAVVPEGPEVVEPGDVIRIAPLYPTGFLQD